MVSMFKLASVIDAPSKRLLQATPEHRLSDQPSSNTSSTTGICARMPQLMVCTFRRSTYTPIKRFILTVHATLIRSVQVSLHRFFRPAQVTITAQFDCLRGLGDHYLDIIS